MSSQVAGDRMEGSVEDHVRACEALIEAENEKFSPDNAVIAALCDSVRFTREVEARRRMGAARQEIEAKAKRQAPEWEPATDEEKPRSWVVSAIESGSIAKCAELLHMGIGGSGDYLWDWEILALANALDMRDREWRQPTSAYDAAWRQVAICAAREGWIEWSNRGKKRLGT